MRSRRRNISGRAIRYLPLIGLTASLGVTLGCGSDTTGPGSNRIEDDYWALQLNHHAITLSLTAPSNQLQLRATPVTVHGDAIATTNTVHYASNDSSVLVDSMGLLTARLVNTRVEIVATLTIPDHNGKAVTLADTAVVTVNAVSAPIPAFATLKMTTPGDSATFGSYLGAPGVTVTALDASNAPLTDPYNVFCQSSNRGVVDYGQGLVNWFQLSNPDGYTPLPGNTTIMCSATIYGVSRSDSIPIRIGMPLYSKITVDTQPVMAADSTVRVSTASVKIGVGGIIQWDNRTQRDSVDLVFDDSTAPQSVPASERIFGSILGFPCFSQTACSLPSAAGNLLLPRNTNRSLNNGIGRDFRRFNTPGTYPYHSTKFPTIVGTIVVVGN